MGSEIFILKTPEAHISTSIAPIASKIVAIDFYAQFMSKKNLLSFFLTPAIPLASAQPLHMSSARTNSTLAASLGPILNIAIPQTHFIDLL